MRLQASQPAASTPKLGPKLEAIAEAEEPDAVVMQRVTDHYASTLKESAEALEYLQKRGLSNGEMLDHFQLGYANRTLAYRLPSKKLSKRVLRFVRSFSGSAWCARAGTSTSRGR